VKLGKYMGDGAKMTRRKIVAEIFIKLYLRTYVTNYNKTQFFPIEILIEVMK